MNKKGFLLLSFVLYLGCYIFFSGVIIHFCVLYIRLIRTMQNQSRAYYAYHSIQKKFMCDCKEAVNVSVNDYEVVFKKKDHRVIWCVHKSYLIRGEIVDHSKSKSEVKVCLCTHVDVFKPFFSQQSDDKCLVGFKANLFCCPFTVFALGQKGKEFEVA